MKCGNKAGSDAGGKFEVMQEKSRDKLVTKSWK